MIALQQCSPSGTTLTPLFFNQGDSIEDRAKRKISHLMYRATELQIPGNFLRSGYAYPCQDPKNHPIRTGISQRSTLVNELERSTSFTLTVYTIPYPQGHQGLQCEGNPPASTPFLFHKDDALPVYNLMHHTYSEDCHRHHFSEASVTPNPAASDTEESDEPPTFPISRKVWGPDLDTGNDTPNWQRAILIQDGRAPGFPQAPILMGQGATIENDMESYTGHIMEVQIKAQPGETVGSVIQKALLKCYPQPKSVPAPHTLRYTLGDFPSHAVRTQEQVPVDSQRIHTIPGVEISLSHEDKLDWITIEDSTIVAFLPNPDKEEETEETHMTEQEGATENPLSNTLDQGDGHQIFVRIPDTYTEKGRRQAYTQTMHTRTSLDSLKAELSLLLAIPTHSFRIHHGGKTLTNQSTLEQQGVLRGMTVWMILGGLFGGADTSMGDSPDLMSPAATPIHPRSQTHSTETQISIDEWIDRLRISSPLTQDLATVNTLMITLNLTKDQATSAILEALNEGDEDRETDVSRYQQVQEVFPELFEKFLEVNNITFPTLQPNWEAFSNSFKEQLVGIARHVDHKINPARKHRLAFRANGQPKEAPHGKHLNETFTLSNLNILSVKPLIVALSAAGFQPGTTGYWSRDITFRPPNQLEPRMGTGSATISIRRTEASDKTLYELYVTRTKSLQIQGQVSQPTWHLHCSDLLAEIEEDSIVLEPPSLDAKRGFQFAIAMHRAGGIPETDFLDNIMFHLAAAGLWQIAELHTLAKDTCVANLLTEKGQGRSGYLRAGVHCGGEKGQQGILSHLILNHENSTFTMDLMSTRNRLRIHMDDLGPEQAGLPITLSLRILQQHTL